MGWWWIAVYLVLGLGGLAVLGTLAWRVVRQGIGVGADLAAAAARTGELASQVQQLPPRPRPEPSVFADPHELRRERSERMRRARRTRARTRSRLRSAR